MTRIREQIYKAHEHADDHKTNGPLQEDSCSQLPVPSCAPTTSELISFSSTFSPPIRIVEAILSASSYDILPVICARPFSITVLTLER